MATLDTVAKIVASLPETAETSSATGLRWWVVKKKTIAWERPLRKSDLAALGARAAFLGKGTILGVWLPDLMTKSSLLSADPDVFFTTPHFDGHPSVLVRLAGIDAKTLRALLTDAWLGRAPKRVAQAFRPPRPRPEGAPSGSRPQQPGGDRAARHRPGAGRSRSDDRGRTSATRSRGRPR
jgi:hypothetical protein